MLDLLIKNNYELLQFQPFIDYIAFLETQGYEFVSESERNAWIEYTAACEDHNLKILSFKDNYKEWITVYKIRNDAKFEKIEFMNFNEKHREVYGKEDYNNFITYSAHFEDEKFTRMVCSSFFIKTILF